MIRSVRLLDVYSPLWLYIDIGTDTDTHTHTLECYRTMSGKFEKQFIGLLSPLWSEFLSGLARSIGFSLSSIFMHSRYIWIAQPVHFTTSWIGMPQSIFNTSLIQSNGKYTESHMHWTQFDRIPPKTWSSSLTIFIHNSSELLSCCAFVFVSFNSINHLHFGGNALVAQWAAVVCCRIGSLSAGCQVGVIRLTFFWMHYTRSRLWMGWHVVVRSSFGPIEQPTGPINFEIRTQDMVEFVSFPCSIIAVDWFCVRNTLPD